MSLFGQRWWRVALAGVLGSAALMLTLSLVLGGWNWTMAEIPQLFRLTHSGGRSDAQREAEYIRWRVWTWRDAYCSSGREQEDRTFDAEAWRRGSAADRGAMVHDLICDSFQYGTSRAETLALLGEPRELTDPILTAHLEEGAIVYRIERKRPFGMNNFPAPPGYYRVPDAYDVNVMFDSLEDAVIYFDVFPAFERSAS